MSNKPTVLFFQFDLMSHFFRALSVANMLKNNYEVIIQSSDKYNTWSEKTQLQSFNCIDLDAKNALKRIGRFDFSWLNHQALEKVLLEQIKVIETYQPDLVIGDTSFTLKMATDYTSTPYISILNGYSTKYYSFTRKLSPKHPIAPFINWLPTPLLNPTVRLGEESNFLLILRQFNKVRAKYNLPKSKHYFDELTGQHNFICDLPEIFPQKRLPSNFSFIGPLFHQNPLSETALLKKLSPDKKTLLLTLGSSEEWEHFIFLNEPEFNAYNILVIGKDNELLSAPFIIKTAFINFNEVLPSVDLVICHGGNGTIYQALLHQVPVLAYPSHLEQGWNIARIEDLGYGQSLEKIPVKHYAAQVKKWINKKTQINWKLNFPGFASSKQAQIILNAVEKAFRKDLSYKKQFVP